MRVVVTGASGNVGTALRRALAPTGVEVTGIARRVPPRADTRWVSCDLGAPAAEAVLTREFTGADAVVHLAWAIQPTTGEPDMRRTNVTGSAHVLRAAARAGVPHVVVASSVAAYTPTSTSAPVDEGWPCNGVPGSAYSAQKVELERMLDDHPNVARIRPCAVVQPDAGGELGRWLLSPLLPPALLGRRWLPVPLWPDLRFQLVHADDVAEAVRLILRRRATGAFNVAADPVLRASDLAAAVGGFLVPVPFRALPGPAWLAWRAGLQPLHPGWLRLAARASLVDTTRLRALGWTPRHDPRQALGAVVAAIAEGRGTWGPLAPRRGPAWRGLGWGRPVHQSQEGGSR
ncbi:NAD-dependent epimerase/dehydratase family protein [Saccharothrix syringae]|uniref:NAD-dependent epimerase/dehydratase family protein n=1 Tax=Saccharothrix syringae TaxID=103733 RepID=A0A5Q0GVC4_SACSY|nr:NAD-dependent epimerase/dehydratase family protein [Saccharothrix syringae]QFZ18027.1 NAD-dependent epimerase/dehydratase family protein [Saccharothrix syringae]